MRALPYLRYFAALSLANFSAGGFSQQSHLPLELSSGAVQSSIGYSTVYDALEALRSRSDVVMRVNSGWTIVTESKRQAVWSFTPATHAAHPAAVVRIVSQRGGDIFIEMKALCQGRKVACDKLIADFQELNDRMRANKLQENRK